MTFFNKKEDVIDIELTQFGKYLLSKGEWDPTYYAFFDDDIIYDSQYSGVSEGQNDAQARITGSARQRTQYVFSGIETEISRLVENAPLIGSEIEKMNIQATDDREYSLSYPLGKSDIGNDKLPAWSITFLNGEITNTIPYSTSSLGIVPRVKLTAKDVQYFTEVRNKMTETNDFNTPCDESTGTGSVEEILSVVGETTDADIDPSDLVFANRVYDDGSYINIIEDQILMEMLEKNTPFEEDNIEIQVFQIETNQETQREVMTPLRFMKKPQAVVNGILLDADEMEQVPQDPTPDCVEYFFNIRVDNEIPIEDLCRAVIRNRNLGLYAPPIVCPEELDLPDGPPEPDCGKTCEDPTFSEEEPDCDDVGEDTI